MNYLIIPSFGFYSSKKVFIRIVMFRMTGNSFFSSSRLFLNASVHSTDSSKSTGSGNFRLFAVACVIAAVSGEQNRRKEEFEKEDERLNLKMKQSFRRNCFLRMQDEAELARVLKNHPTNGPSKSP
jgi:hypothetical protein